VVDLEHEIERAIVVDARQVARNGHDELQGLAASGRRESGGGPGLPTGRRRQCRKAVGLLRHRHRHPGLQEGDAFDWRIPNRTRRISIEKVLYQPEAAGDFDL
jgi:regulator of nucleoside diphosphate kinase